MLDKVKKALADPARLAYMAWEKTAPAALYARYTRLAAEAGLDRLYFVLSFDCDTEDDIRVVEGVHQRLADMGARPVYAVPGELLQRGEKTYRKLAESGSEFINHGYTEHTYFDTARGAHASCFFYDQLEPAVVERDIVQGDACLKSLLGITPRGFRAPHFGTYQKPAQLRFMQGVLQGLGYAFSTSSVPLYGLRYGPAFRDFGVLELPVSGMGSSPLTILDSWGCFMAPGRRRGPEDYGREGRLAADKLAQGGVGILNYYADPCHIHDQDVFFETVAAWLAVAQPVSYGELLEVLK